MTAAAWLWFIQAIINNNSITWITIIGRDRASMKLQIVRLHVMKHRGWASLWLEIKSKNTCKKSKMKVVRSIYYSWFCSCWLASLPSQFYFIFLDTLLVRSKINNKIIIKILHKKVHLNMMNIKEKMMTIIKNQWETKRNQIRQR